MRFPNNLLPFDYYKKEIDEKFIEVIDDLFEKLKKDESINNEIYKLFRISLEEILEPVFTVQSHPFMTIDRIIDYCWGHLKDIEKKRHCH